jgi:hypothetical protein
VLTTTARKTVALGPGVHTLRIEHVSGGAFVLHPLAVEVADASVLLAGAAACTAAGTASLAMSVGVAGVASCSASGTALLTTTVGLAGVTSCAASGSVSVALSVSLVGTASCVAGSTAPLTMTVGVSSIALCTVASSSFLDVQEAGIAGLSGTVECAALGTASLGTELLLVADTLCRLDSTASLTAYVDILLVFSGRITAHRNSVLRKAQFSGKLVAYRETRKLV